MVCCARSVQFDAGVRRFGRIPRQKRLRWAGAGNLSLGEQRAYRSDDGGATWAQTTQPGSRNRGTVAAFLPDRRDSDVVLAAVVAQLALTTDAGVTWRPVLDLRYPSDFGLAANDTVVVAAADESRPGSLKTSLGVYRSSALGGTWDTLPTLPDAWGGSAVTIDRFGQLVIGTRRGVWLLQR